MVSYVFILGIITNSCTQYTTVELTSTPFNTYTATPTITTTATFNSTSTKGPSPTETVPPVKPTIKPYEDLTNQQKQDIVIDLMETNGNCNLHCYWGIVPGKTYWYEYEAYLESLSDTITQFEGESEIRKILDHIPLSIKYFHKSIDGNKSEIKIAFSVDSNGLIEMIDTESPVTDKSFHLQLMLKTYGPPDEIRSIFSTSGGAAAPWYPHYYLGLVYIDEGFVAEFSGETEYDYPYHILCPDKTGPYLHLFNKDRLDRYLILSLMGQMGWGNPITMSLIDDYPEMSLEKFSSILSEPNECVKIYQEEDNPFNPEYQTPGSHPLPRSEDSR